MPEYKAKGVGVWLTLIDYRDTSHTCFSCENMIDDLSLSKRTYHC